MAIPTPDSLSDNELAAALKQIIDGLAAQRVYLQHTDHLTDRQLYTCLFSDLLDEQVKDMPLAASASWFIDLCGSGSEEDMQTYFRYYAEVQWREQWMKEFPDYTMPEHVAAPERRDSGLPAPAADETG
ncbi:MAG TPA: hypothetical protein VGS41_11530 [Chthonomonadales bacterium]|nr:hypothetical protein [Chthonomonadales bacterium]